MTSAEGATQGDTLAMSLYAISLQPLITRLNSSSLTKQCWYADDRAGAGTLRELRKWWNVLNEMGPSLGYYSNAKKCWILTKKGKEDGKGSIPYLRKARSIWALS